MTSETVTILASGAGVLIAAIGGLGGVLAWGIRRIDARFERIDARFERVDARFDRVDARFERVDARFDRVDSGIAAIKDELTEVKVILARLEGPRPRLIVDGR